MSVSGGVSAMVALALLSLVVGSALQAAVPTLSAAPAPSLSAEPALEAPPSPAAAPSPEDEVRSMLASMSQAEVAVREMLQRADAQVAQGRALFHASEESGRVSLLERVSARVHELLDAEALAATRISASTRLEAGETPAARAAIIDYMGPLMARGEEAATLLNYVPRRIQADLGTARLRALLGGNGQSAPVLPRIEQLEALLAAREAREDFLMGADLELAELEDLLPKAYDAAFLAAVTAARQKPAGTLKPELRSARCPVVTDAGPVGDAPRISTVLSAPTADYYPAAALTQGVDGKVVIQAEVTPEGCVRTASVAVSSGVEALDAAALRWMLEGAVFARSRPLRGRGLATTLLSVSFKSMQ